MGFVPPHLGTILERVVLATLEEMQKANCKDWLVFEDTSLYMLNDNNNMELRWYQSLLNCCGYSAHCRSSLSCSGLAAGNNQHRKQWCGRWICHVRRRPLAATIFTPIHSANEKFLIRVAGAGRSKTQGQTQTTQFGQTPVHLSVSNRPEPTSVQRPVVIRTT